MQLHSVANQYKMNMYIATFAGMYNIAFDIELQFLGKKLLFSTIVYVYTKVVNWKIKETRCTMPYIVSLF